MKPDKVCIIGGHGLIGSALAARYLDVTSIPTRDTKILFHFGSHTHPRFNENPHYEMKQILDSFSQLLPFCYEHGILFVYPSSALVYERDTQFSMFKKTLEHLAACYPTRTLGLRIFPVYGPREQHTVISQWCRQMARDERPTVYGDGKQERDFIYIDDVVDQIVQLAEYPHWRDHVRDIGAGKLTSFNDIVAMINAELGTNLEPRYVQKPHDYPTGITCPRPLPVKTPVELGIRKILQGIRTHEVVHA